VWHARASKTQYFEKFKMNISTHRIQTFHMKAFEYEEYFFIVLGGGGGGGGEFGRVSEHIQVFEKNQNVLTAVDL
jgi:anthranilate/para-aminobenzoate synthase component II